MCDRLRKEQRRAGLVWYVYYDVIRIEEGQDPDIS